MPSNSHNHVKSEIFAETSAFNIHTNFLTKVTTTQFIFISLIYLACIIIFFNPYLPNLTTHLIGPPEDNMLDFWTIWYSRISLNSDPFAFYRTNLIFYPEGDYLIYHGFSYSNLLPILAIFNIFSLPNSTGVLVGTQNLTLMFSYYLCAIGCFYLAKHYTKDNMSSLIAGFIFAFNPSHFAHSLHHFGISMIQYIPFFVLFFLKYIETRNWKSFAGAILFFCLNALSCWYYIVYATYYLLLYYVFHAIQERKLLLSKVATPIFSIISTAFLLLSPVVIPMLIEGLRNPKVNMHNGILPGADLLSAVVFHPYHLLNNFTRYINSHFVGNPWEMTAYLGIINLCLVLWWLIKKQKTMPIQGLDFQLWGLITFVLLAEGPFLHILGRALPIPLPTFIAQFIPFFKNARTPSRSIVFAYLFLSIIIAMITKRYMSSISRRKGIIFFVILSILVFIDYYPAPASFDSTEVYCPKAYEIIKKDPDPKVFGVLDLPFGYEEGTRYMMYQTFHGKPIVAASVARKLRETLLNKIEMADLSSQKDQLIANKVKYIVIHKNLNTDPNAETISISEYTRSYPVVYVDSDEIVIKVY